MDLIYVAGPYRDKSPLQVKKNIENARSAGAKLMVKGWVPVIPHTMYGGGEYWEELTDNDKQNCFLDCGLALLLRCDAIFMLSNWFKSRGSRDERRLAKVVGCKVPSPSKLSIPIYYQDEGYPDP